MNNRLIEKRIKMRWRDTSNPVKPLRFQVSQVRHFVDGLRRVKSELSKLRPTDTNIIEKTFSVILVSIHLLLRRKQGKKFVIVVSVPKNNWTIWRDKNYILEKNSLVTELLQTSALVSTGNERDYRPFWNLHSKEISTRLWLPTETDCRELPLNLSNGSCTRRELKSPSLTKKNTGPQNKSSQRIFFPSSQSTLVSKWENEGIRSKKIRLKPTPSQRIVLKKWIEHSRFTYNKGVDEINRDSKSANFQTLRNKFVTGNVKGKRNENVPDWLLETPKDIRAETLKELTSSFKGNITKLKRRQIKYFDLKHRTKKTPGYVMTIPKTAIKILDKKIKIYGKYIKDGIKIKEKPGEIHHDCKLEWRYPNHFYLIIPYKKGFEAGNKKKSIVALDPGIRKFMTGFSKSETFEFHPSSKIDRYNQEIDRIKSKVNNKRRAILKRTLKIRNIVREFHYEVINYLTKKYKTILLPSFDSQELFGKRRVIHRSSARKLNYLSHYKFKERLKHRCDLTNTELYIVDESFTSKTCTRCGVLNNVGSCEVYECQACELIIDRDVNGARNIFIKNVDFC